jgi:hypothetical protein
MWVVVGVVTLEQVSFEYFGFPCPFSFHQILDTPLPSGTIGPIVAGVAPHPTPLNKQQEVLGRIIAYFSLKLQGPHSKRKNYKDTQTHRQQGDLISLFLFLQNKESKINS